MRKWTLIVVLFVCGSSYAEAEKDEGLRLVEAFVYDIETFAADFQQTLLDGDDEVIDSSAGRLLVQRPGKFRWDNSEPYEQWLIADGLNIWSYDVDLEQVTVKPQSGSLANTPALILSGAGASLDQFRHIETYRENIYLWVRLEPVEEDSGFSRMELGFVDDELTRMVFFDNLGQTTLVQLADIEINRDIPDAEFVFTVPEGVDLIGQPASAALPSAETAETDVSDGSS